MSLYLNPETTMSPPNARARSLSLILLLASASCATAIHSSVDPKAFAPIRKVALVPTIIGGVSLPVFPLLDAGVVRASVNGISEEIVAAEQAVVSGYAEKVQAHLRNDLHLEVMAMEASAVDASAPGPEQSAAKPDDSPPRFPKVFAGGLDPLGFRTQQIATLSNVDLAADAKRICKAMDVDAIAVSYTRLEVYGATMVGMSCGVRLNSWLHVVDREGRCVVRMDFSTDENSVISPGDIKGFERALRSFDAWVVRMFLDARQKLPGAPQERKLP